MKEFRDRVAVITGAASGIGRALARRAAREGMKVVLADIEPGALAEAEAELSAGGAAVRAVVTDVSRAAEVEALAEETVEAFGGVHLLCNNAGVGWGGPVWEIPLSDWEWVLGVNLWGVIHGIRAFVPRMLAQEAESHVVNTGSVAGLLPGGGVYGVSKHGVVALSESLYHGLAARGIKVGVSVLCPGFVNSPLLDSSARRRPSVPGQRAPIPAEAAAALQGLREALAAGMSPERVADHVFDAVREERFYILTHPIYKGPIRNRMEDILEDRPPTDLRGFFQQKGEY